MWPSDVALEPHLPTHLGRNHRLLVADTGEFLPRMVQLMKDW